MGFPCIELLDFLKSRGHDLLEGHEVVDHPLLGNTEDLLFSPVHNGLGRFVFPVSHLHYGRAGAYEVPENGFFLDNGGIILGICCRGDRINEMGQVRGPSCIFELVPVSQLVGEGNEIDGLSFFIELEHGGINDLVSALIEIRGLGKDLHNPCQRRLFYQAGTQRRLLRVHILGGDLFCCHGSQGNSLQNW